jgi:Lar family restriction alleviation protein
MTEKLKVCPFCGDSGDLRVSYVRCSDEHQWFHVECPDCVITGPHAFVEGAAIAAWNTRTDDRASIIEECAVIADDQDRPEVATAIRNLKETL